MREEKKDVWLIDVERFSTLKVVFSNPVTEDEAEDLFLSGDHEDVLDEQDHGYEVVGIS